MTIGKGRNDPFAYSFEPARAPPTVQPCDLCGGLTFEVRCKIICRRCGYTRDCSDP